MSETAGSVRAETPPPEQAAQPAIQTRNLTVRFGRNEALSGLDLSVPAGAIFALVGPNGAGKTTLIKTLLNLYAPTSGTASVLAMPSTAVRGHALERIGYVSENQELPGWMTLDAFLDYLRPFYPTWDRELERQLVEQFRLPAGRRLRQMSRGQQMKAALLSSLAFRPGLVILDEPFSGLDPLARDEFIEGLLDRAAAQEADPPTILLSSHDLAEIESFATHVAYLEEGRMLFSEEIATLTSRFREITVTLDRDAPGGAELGVQAVPATIPASWLLPERGASLTRFVHSQAASEPVDRQIAAVFPHVIGIQSEPMSLRSIFVALARAGRPASTASVKRSRA